MEQCKRSSHTKSSRIKQKLDKLAEDVKNITSERQEALKELMNKRLYTSEEAAELLGLSFPSIRRAITIGRLKIVRVGRFVRIPAHEIERLLQESEGTLSVSEAAKILNINPTMVRLLIKRGELKGFRFADAGRFRIPKNEVERVAREGVSN